MFFILKKIAYILLLLFCGSVFLHQLILCAQRYNRKETSIQIEMTRWDNFSVSSELISNGLWAHSWMEWGTLFGLNHKPFSPKLLISYIFYLPWYYIVFTCIFYVVFTTHIPSTFMCR